jgi:predicted nucleotidyltransferase
MDFFVERTEKNAMKLLNAIADFGFESLGFKVEDVMDEQKYISMGISPLRIDILTSISGVTFDEVMREATNYFENGVELKVIHINQLISNKIASGRPKDLDDVQALSKIVKKMKVTISANNVNFYPNNRLRNL